MLAKRIPTIMPDLTLEEALEVTKIHSVIHSRRYRLNVTYYFCFKPTFPIGMETVSALGWKQGKIGKTVVGIEKW